tara:strand:- start:2892 stop:3092 length:201 start_codon:yes stop_codon:yes gene_type:complete
MIVYFALSMSEMGLSPLILFIVLISSLLFIVGFVKSSQENEYKKLMDSFIYNQEDEEVDSSGDNSN